MTAAKTGPLLDPDWLAARLDDPAVRVIDATFVMPDSGRDARAEFATRHIPGAQFFDIDDIADRDSELPHMLPSAGRFAERVGALGIGDDHMVVAYDSHGLMSAARAWWMFRVFGHDRVAVLDGGLPAWQTAGHPLGDTPSTPTPARLEARYRPDLVRSRDEVIAGLDRGAEQVVDARAAGRFDGSVPETWPGRRSGHIPGSRSLPFTDLLDPETRRVLPPERLASLFASAGVAPDRPLVATCGSGVTACVLALGRHLLGDESAAVYDGSWSEWGLREELPVELGPAGTG